MTSPVTQLRGRAYSEIKKISPADFIQCKEHLARHFHLLPEKQHQLVAASAEQLYTVGATLGIAPNQLAEAIATFLHLPYLAEISHDAIRSGGLSASFCRAHLSIAIHQPTAPYAFAICNPFDFALMEALRNHASPDRPLRMFVSAPDVISCLLDSPMPTATAQGLSLRQPLQPGEQLYDLLANVEPEGIAEIEVPQEYKIVSEQEAEKIGTLPPVVRLVNMILSNAVKAGASDIHVEPQETVVQVRHRIDGLLVNVLKIPKHLHMSLVSRFKIIARLDISEHRKPQDGRSRLRFEDRLIDLRISTLPTQFGQKIVIRLLDSKAALLNLDQLTFAPDTKHQFVRLLQHPAGMILVTGPTGSGKTTTLYAAVNWLKSPTHNIITVENPVEFQIPGITQVQVDVKAGMTFASGMRSILRQDPDIILVGEIRDRETAGIALEASQTGHLVLSTLHTNDAPTAITRLLDLEVEPFKIASSLVGVMAQRLLRQVCPVCTVDTDLRADVLEQLGESVPLPDGAQWKMSTGCDACYQSGFKGRVAIHEFLEITEDIRALIHQKAPDYMIRNLACQGGMRTLQADGVAKAALGLTTLEEVLRVAPQTKRTQMVSSARVPGVTPREPLLTSVVPTQPAMPPAVAMSRASEGSPHLLIIEDDEDTQALLAVLLEKHGYTITIAGDGVEGLMHMGKQYFDLILSDVNMPYLDGLQLMNLKRQKGLPAPVIFLTADTAEDSEQRCLELGAVDYVRKPIKKDVLLLRIHKALAKQ